MIQITPQGHQYTRTNQDHDEQQALLSDLTRNSIAYLQHADPQIRALACAAYQAYKLETPAYFLPESNAHLLLARLYRYLRSRAIVGQVPR